MLNVDRYHVSRPNALLCGLVRSRPSGSQSFAHSSKTAVEAMKQPVYGYEEFR